MRIKKNLCLFLVYLILLISLFHTLSATGAVLFIGFNILIGLMCISKTNQLLHKMGYGIGHAVAYIFLAILYYLYISPIAIFFKIKKSVQTISVDTYKTFPKTGKISFDDMH